MNAVLTSTTIKSEKASDNIHRFHATSPGKKASQALPQSNLLRSVQTSSGNMAVQRVLAGQRADEVTGLGAQSYSPTSPRRCACGGIAGPDGECAACRARRVGLQRQVDKAAGQRAPTTAPPIVHEALRSPGQPLDAATRAFMEPRFGRDFSAVRVHTGQRAEASAQAVNAHAYTVGQDIVFGAGKYTPHTPAGQHLLAHELTHTLQQGSADKLQPSLLVGQPDDALEREATAVADEVLAGGVLIADGLSRDATPRIQRYSWDEFKGDVGGAASAVGETVVGVGTAIGETVVGVGTAVGETVVGVGGALAQGVGATVDWFMTTAGRAALEAANALAGLFGGSVVIRGGCLIITIPEIPLFPSFQRTLGETPPMGYFLPLLGGGIMVGPIPLAGVVGLLGYAQGSIEAAVGPGVLRGIRVEVCPLTGRYLGTAQLYVAAAIGPRLTLFGGVAGAVGTIIPVEPPIPIIVIAQGGLRGTGTGWLIGAVQNTVTVLYSGGRLSFSNVTNLMGGVLLQGDLDIFAALRLYDKIICQYVYPLGHWETGRAWRLTIPISASLGGGSGTGGVGPITWGPMPIGDIQTAIRRLPSGWDCLSWQEIKKYLCDIGILPPEWCEDGEIEPQRKELALAICKCQARKNQKPEDCGAGIYKKCFYTDKDGCDHRKVKREAERLCNHNLPECKRPACELHHTDYKCPVKESECRDGYFGAEEPVVPEDDPCAVPVNFRQTVAKDKGNGVLYFEYAWDSSTGNLKDLKSCRVGEIVTYPGKDPFVWPKPPWDGATPNPTIIWPSPGSDGGIGDEHTSKPFVKPYKEAGFTATQYYRYECPCDNNGKPVNLMGPISIVRAVIKKSDGKFKYVITKSGKSASIDPLP
ncbi:MAG TPA: DUF4157 domain-containing protein [Chloroflexia bacterium]|nr:DUF4157 domain-containing protein [Chloroflexia bacterium]